MSDYLCEELITDIFTRLPAKSLLRFRSLSKSLCSCIASPSFIRMHASRSPQQVLIKHDMLYTKPGSQNFYTLHSADKLPLFSGRGYIGIEAAGFPYNRDREYVGSCNGILGLFDRKNSRITFWNPSIRRKFKVNVPDCPDEFPSRPGRCCCKPCLINRGCVPDPIVLLGFGLDPITDDYKIVSMSQYQGNKKSSYIYTMKRDAWRLIASPAAPSFYKATSRGCFVNGSLHWVVQRDSTLSDEVAHFYILAFNLSTHVFGKIVLPEPNWKTKQLTTIHGSLAAVSTKHDGDSWIWVMKEYNNDASWFVFFKSKSNKVKGLLRRVLQPTGNGDLFFITSSYNEGFQVYDHKKRTRSKLQNFMARSFIIDMETYVESLELIE